MCKVAPLGTKSECRTTVSVSVTSPDSTVSEDVVVTVTNDTVGVDGGDDNATADVARSSVVLRDDSMVVLPASLEEIVVAEAVSVEESSKVVSGNEVACSSDVVVPALVSRSVVVLGADVSG